MEKNVRIVIRASLIAMSLSGSFVSAQTTPVEPQVTASGRGEVQIKPTRATLYFTVQGKAETAALAASKNAELVAATMKSLLAAGLRSENITNANYSVAPDYEFSTTGRKQIGFVASNGIRVELANIADVGKVIDAGLAGGATQVTSAQYSGDKMDEARRTALKAAVEQARHDAEAMAAAAGGELGRLVFLTSGLVQGFPDRGIELGGGTVAARATEIRPADLTVSAFATGRWEFVTRK
jgi:uncharacterized protein YggE